MSLDQPGTSGTPVLRIARSGPLREHDLRVVDAEDPAGTVRWLAAESGAAVAGGLSDGARVLAHAVDLVARASDAAQAREALALAKRLEASDEAADDRLLARRDELQAARALGPAVADQLTDLHRRMALLHFAEHKQEVAAAALAARRDSLPFDLPAGVDLVELRRARDAIRSTQADLELADLRMDEAAETASGLAEVRDTEDAEAALAESAARRLSASESLRYRTLRRRAALIALPAVGLVAATGLGLIDRLVGLGLSLATVPPIIEVLRRSRAARLTGQRRVRGAESLARRAAQKHLGALEAARNEHLALVHVRAEAARARFAASAGWLAAAGPRVPEEHADAAVEAAGELAELRREASAAAVAADGLRQAFATELAGLGAPPGLEPHQALRELQELADLRPVADELLAAVAEAEQRRVQREVLRALMGSRDMAAVRRAARSRSTVSLDPLIVVDDGDPVHGPLVVSALRDLGGAMAVTIVTERPKRWQQLVDELARRAPDEPVGPSAGGEALARSVGP